MPRAKASTHINIERHIKGATRAIIATICMAAGVHLHEIFHQLTTDSTEKGFTTDIGGNSWKRNQDRAWNNNCIHDSNKNRPDSHMKSLFEDGINFFIVPHFPKKRTKKNFTLTELIFSCKSFLFFFKWYWHICYQFFCNRILVSLSSPKQN